MNRIQQLFIILMIALAFGACKPTAQLSNDYEVRAMGQGKQGTTLVKVYSYGETVEDAVERAKMDALHALLFKGIPGSNNAKPMITDPMVEQEGNDYFRRFFGIDTWIFRKNAKSNRKMAYTQSSAPYKLFVQQSSDGSVSSRDTQKVPGGYKVGVVVSLNHQQLRRKLEQDGMVRKFGL
jgi:hypothetical protein